MVDEHDSGIELPTTPIHRITKPIERFMHVEAAGGVVLVACTVAALVLANIPATADWFVGIWKTKLTIGVGGFQMSHPLYHWINDGLMAILFFAVGLEVKREVVLGELKETSKAALPIAAALGGMVVPAAVYLGFQWNGEAPNGWGIPMATDIAFVVGCMAVLGKRVPRSLRVLLLSLAIVDDIGAVLVIAIAYTEKIDFTALVIGILAIGVITLIARLGVRSLLVYVVLGAGVWLAFHESGVHATIAGVTLGLLTPTSAHLRKSTFEAVLDRASEVFRGGEWDRMSHRAQKIARFKKAAQETVSPVEYLEGVLHPWTAFVIIPVFALANAGVPISLGDFANPIAIAVGAGLLIGKPLGIFAFAMGAVKLGLARLPDGVTATAILGGGALAGIGFTMAMFIAGLAFKGSPETLDAAKVGILGASALSAALGMGILLAVLKKPDEQAKPED